VRERTIAAVLLLGGVIGGLVGGLLSAYWWDFPPEDVKNYGDFIVPFYATMGAIGGLIVAGLVIALGAAFLELREGAAARDSD
jgi:MFS family permease